MIVKTCAARVNMIFYDCPCWLITCNIIAVLPIQPDHIYYLRILRCEIFYHSTQEHKDSTSSSLYVHSGTACKVTRRTCTHVCVHSTSYEIQCTMYMQQYSAIHTYIPPWSDVPRTSYLVTITCTYVHSTYLYIVYLYGEESGHQNTVANYEHMIRS